MKLPILLLVMFLSVMTVDAMAPAVNTTLQTELVAKRASGFKGLKKLGKRIPLWVIVVVAVLVVVFSILLILSPRGRRRGKRKTIFK